MRTPRRTLPPLKPADLEWFALRYVERYATSRAKLAAYLARKIRERGWEDATPPDVAALAQRMADRGYVDDRGFAETKAGAMGRRGLGGQRVAEALRQAGIEAEDAAAADPIVTADRVSSAIAFARRKRIGPFGREAADRPMRQKQLAAMLRAGHPMDISRRIVGMAIGEDPAALLEEE